MARPKTNLDQLPNEEAARQPIAQTSQNVLENIEQLEDSLWSAADNLRANSKLESPRWNQTLRRGWAIGGVYGLESPLTII